MVATAANGCSGPIAPESTSVLPCTKRSTSMWRTAPSPGSVSQKQPIGFSSIVRLRASPERVCCELHQSPTLCTSLRYTSSGDACIITDVFTVKPSVEESATSANAHAGQSRMTAAAKRMLHLVMDRIILDRLNRAVTLVYARSL